jgi:photosystem II stability/assembly factor-like uncharacterized protein
MRTFLFLFVIFLAVKSIAQPLTIDLVPPQTDASFRGLSVVNDNNAWVSGSKGWVGHTNDGGRSWKFKQVPGFEKFDFRAIYAFDTNSVVIANAGAPANILLTNDGGASWKTVYTNNDTSAFIDGVDFWNEKEGVIYGDPIQGRMLLLKTTDGGLTWQEFTEEQRPMLNQGEASFAASGTNIRCSGSNELMIATGGSVSRLWSSLDKGRTWRTIETPILQGEAATGIFSFARKFNRIIIVGGNYLQDSLRTKHVFFSMDKGKNWSFPSKSTGGYRECVEYITENLLIVTGPSGTDVSRDGGRSWEPASKEKYFHVVRKARKGKLVLIAGGKGKIGVVKIK